MSSRLSRLPSSSVITYAVAGSSFVRISVCVLPSSQCCALCCEEHPLCQPAVPGPITISKIKTIKSDFFSASCTKCPQHIGGVVDQYSSRDFEFKNHICQTDISATFGGLSDQKIVPRSQELQGSQELNQKLEVPLVYSWSYFHYN